MPPVIEPDAFSPGELDIVRAMFAVTLARVECVRDGDGWRTPDGDELERMAGALADSLASDDEE